MVQSGERAELGRERPENAPLGQLRAIGRWTAVITEAAADLRLGAGTGRAFSPVLPFFGLGHGLGRRLAGSLAG